MVSFTYDGTTLVVVLLGKTCYVDSSTARFVSIIEAIKDNKSEEYIYDLINSTQSLSSYVNSQNNPRVTVVGDTVYVDGEELHDSIAERIIDFKDNGLPINHLVNFLERIYANPSYNSRTQLFDFLMHKDLVITEDGHFLAYKSVTTGYKDWHTGKIDNSPGSVVKMDRRLIDDNPNSHCSKGLHVGAMQYASSFRGGQKIVIVKVDPANVVSVPNDCSCQKCRVCEYTVLKDSEGVMDQPLYTSEGEKYQPTEYEGDWDFADEIDDIYDDGEVYSYDEEEYENDSYIYHEDDEDDSQPSRFYI